LQPKIANKVTKTPLTLTAFHHRLSSQNIPAPAARGLTTKMRMCYQSLVYRVGQRK